MNMRALAQTAIGIVVMSLGVSELCRMSKFALNVKG
jgi:hypothetical protein